MVYIKDTHCAIIIMEYIYIKSYRPSASFLRLLLLQRRGLSPLHAILLILKINFETEMSFTIIGNFLLQTLRSLIK